MARRTAILALLCVAAALALAEQAQAQAVEPLGLLGTTPADGQVVPVTPTGGIAWQVTALAPPGAAIAVTVSTRPTLGGDGAKLDTANRVDFFFLSEGATAGTWSGRSDPGPNAWSDTAGTYFWQVTATWTDAAGAFHQAAGPVARIFLGTPPAGTPGATGPAAPGARTTLAMSSLDATSYVRAAIRLRTKRTPSRLRYGCKRVTSRSFRCRPTWRDRRNLYSAVTATFTHTRTRGRIVARGTLTGRRATRTCARGRSVRSCGVRFRWRTVTAARRRGT